ncbi:MAG TPA: diacylglycerol kinase family protein [Acidimicrobiales bacterium]|jgi:diacylglycerol kinase family enzyme|nr:diacylglycerol kinase family protein [Acidimicrobiales bacterium]
MSSSASHAVLIVNPKSGGGKAQRNDLVTECGRRGIEPLVLGNGDDLSALAASAVAAGAEIIGMAGGDGSQAVVASVASDHDVGYVCVPAGTRNHFALDLGVDRNDVVGSLDAFSEGTERRIDLARVNGRLFVNNACLGLYAKIVQSPEYRDAKAKTVTEMLPELLGPRAEPFDLRFTGPDGTHYPTAHLLLVSNNPYHVRRLGARGTRGSIDQGTLGVIAARLERPTELARFQALDAVGKIDRFHGWLEWSTPTFTIDSGATVDIALDGEASKIDPPLRFEIVPSALRVRLPRRRAAPRLWRRFRHATKS